MPWLRYKSDHHTPLFRGADDGKAETSAPTCNKKTSCDTARVPRMCVFSRATLSVAFLLSSTCSQLEPNVSWKNARSVALIRRQPCSVAVAPKLSHLSHLFFLFLPLLQGHAPALYFLFLPVSLANSPILWVRRLRPILVFFFDALFPI